MKSPSHHPSGTMADPPRPEVEEASPRFPDNSLARVAPRREPTPYERIKQAILDATLAPAEPLTEQLLAQWCGVSRTPIREALVRLAQDGLIERRERAFYVRDRTPEEILDIYEVRITLETSAARLAAERHGPIDRIRVERALAACRALDADADGGRLTQANRAFHESVRVAASSDALTDLLDRLNMHLARYPATTLTHPDRWRHAVEEHAAMAAAIFARDAVAAASLTEAHFIAAREIRLAAWRRATI